MLNIEGKRIVQTHRMTVPASPEEVFPLLCPIREMEWIEGWEAKVVGSSSGVAELGGVFSTVLPDEGVSYWLMSRYIPSHEAEYVRFLPGWQVFIMLKIMLTPVTEGTQIEAAFSHHAVGEAGIGFIGEQTDESFRQQMEVLESSLRHFLATGTMLRGIL